MRRVRTDAPRSPSVLGERQRQGGLQRRLLVDVIVLKTERDGQDSWHGWATQPPSNILLLSEPARLRVSSSSGKQVPGTHILGHPLCPRSLSCQRQLCP